MALMEKLRIAIRDGHVKPIFNARDLKNAGIDDPNNNLSNYDNKNTGSSNTNRKVLISREINGEKYYSFDEQLFD
jgi:hypothetical protein